MGGTLSGPPGATQEELAALAVTGPVVFDSRDAAAGALFVAFPGEAADGHDFVQAAVDKGAVAVLAAPDDAYRKPWTARGSVPTVTVGDGDLLRALSALATAHLARLPRTTVIGLTGSAGKTTTKDLIGRLTRELGPTVAPKGSFNNELGFPITVLRTDEDTRYLVAEMGARGIGHIKHLTTIAPPRIGVVLNVGSAHLGEFGSVEAIAEAKGELAAAVPESGNCNPDRDGVAILNADDARVRGMAARTKGRVVLFGESPDADVRAEDVRVGSDGRASFTLLYRDGEGPHRYPVALRLVGEHQVSNALAAAATGLELGLAGEKVAEVLSAAEPDSKWRMAIGESADGVTVLNDAYNANPESMRAALKTLATMARARPGARSWAVLGTMAELGDDSAVEHDAVGRLAVRLNIAQTVAVGAGAAAIHSGASMEGSYNGESVAVPDADAALAFVRAGARPGDVVLVKASRAIGLEALAAALLDRAVDAHGDSGDSDGDFIQGAGDGDAPQARGAGGGVR
ncbi:UDP-N-acetylmuramoyl-tripeptide--D-alanyl-D-alanine ligase [Catenulispora acidiphila]|uniref:UDP-N-acetylmuramoyl-tripeptide--D-alanyl-D- alanine ligase n=1 Tax=Catenulispora acidiphila TaxID=304895 RepID=UPI00019DF894